jgi:hypothetical protein
VQAIADMISRRDKPAEALGSGSSTDAPKPGRHRYWTEKELVMDEQPYKVVGSCLMLVKMVGDHLLLAKGIPMVAGEAMNRLVELLRVRQCSTAAFSLGRRHALSCPRAFALG